MAANSDWPLILAGMATLVTALAGLVTSLRNTGKIAEVHQLVNSQSEKLNRLIGERAFIEGHAAGLRERKPVDP